MAFDFPANPVQGAMFTDTATGTVYIWNSYAWGRRYSEPPVGATHPPAETIPVEPPIDGADNVNDVLVNLSSQVDVLATQTGNKVDVAGDTMTGPLILSEHPTALSPEFQAATKGFVSSIAGLPPGGLEGQVLAISSTGIATWGAPIVGANF